jgi:hypothetical protein
MEKFIKYTYNSSGAYVYIALKEWELYNSEMQETLLDLEKKLLFGND